ncbi:MAG: glycosyltransferase [Candidatus Levybacteria bacterium]|nr:glycosyltransferase [Candidatus Levybacteria bacterium]
MLNKNDTVLIICHYTQLEDRVNSIGPPQDLRRFLLKRVKRITYILLPFPYAVDNRCYIDIYENGKLIKAKKTFRLRGPDLLQYLLHPLIILYFSLFTSPFTVCFALDNLSTLSVLPLRLIKITKKLVYFSIDYTAYRFQSKILNFLYHAADKIACATADINWVQSQPMLNIKKTKKFFIGNQAVFHEVPTGFPKRDITVLPIGKIDRYHLVFAGVLLEKQGLQLVIEALPKLLSYFPKLLLTIIGSGDYEDELKRITKKYNVNRFVNFTGYIANHRKIEDILTKCGIGLAPYKPDPSSYTYFASPIKPKIYLGCGLPVIITNVPSFAQEIDKHKAGIIINYSRESLIKAIKIILKSSKTYATFREAALNLSKQCDTEVILQNALSKTF